MLKNIIHAIIYFTLSTVITWWYIVQANTLYISYNTMLLSCTIAGAKWGIQIIAALRYLQVKKWEFLKRIGFTCFISSCILLPYCIFSFVRAAPYSFLVSLVLAVLLMIVTYYKVVKQLCIASIWFWGWFCCLVMAISLQLFWVFSLA